MIALDNDLHARFMRVTGIDPRDSRGVEVSIRSAEFLDGHQDEEDTRGESSQRRRDSLRKLEGSRQTRT